MAAGLVAAILAMAPVRDAQALAQLRQAGDFVAIDKPKLSVGYTYERTDQRGTVSRPPRVRRPVGPSVDEYWRSIEHGVVVKHTSTLPGGATSEVLVSIR